MSSILPAPAFSWTNVAQTGVFTNLDVGTSHYLMEGVANLVADARDDSTLYSPPDRHPSLGIGPTLQETEERILANMPVSYDRAPHIALFCPGPSKIDPLYARRLMDRIQDRFGTPSRLTICERTLIPETDRYYQGLDWGTHDVSYRLGSSGDVEKLRGLDADLILIFHPNMIYDVLYEALAGNLVSGGLAFWQEDFYRNQPASDLEDILSMLGQFFEASFVLSQEPIAGPLVNTYFARILSSQIVSFLLQKK